MSEDFSLLMMYVNGPFQKAELTPVPLGHIPVICEPFQRIVADHRNIICFGCLPY